MINFVVVRHHEDLGWINRLPEDVKVYVYNKGPAIPQGTLRDGVTVEALKNSGRQAAAYLFHLRTRFCAADGDDTVFTQANPFEHAPALLHLLAQSAVWRDVQPLSVQRSEKSDIPPRQVLEDDRRDWIDGLPVRAEHYSLHTLSPLASFNEEADAAGRTYLQKHALPAGTNIVAHFLDLCGLERLAETARESDIGVFAYASIFAVRHARIEQFMNRAGRCLPSMELLARADLNYDAIFERCWLHLFGEPFVRLPALRAPNAPAPADETAGTSDTTVQAIAAIRQKAYQAWSEGRASDARALLQRVLHHDPRNVEVLADFAAFALQAEKFELAARYARSALAVDPRHGPTRFTLAMALGRAGLTDDAAQAFGELLDGPDAAAFRADNPELAQIAAAEALRLRLAAAAAAEAPQAAQPQPA